MPLRPDLPSGLNLNRRAATPVKLPRMNFPMIGAMAGEGAGSSEQTMAPDADPAAMPHGPSILATLSQMAPMASQPGAQPHLTATEAIEAATAGFAESQASQMAAASPAPAAATAPAPPGLQMASQMAAPAAQPAPQTAQPAPQMAQPAPQPAGGPPGARVIVYGRAGCQACVEAIQDLMERQVNFTYYDVGRDPMALNHVQAICGGGVPMVPVIVQIGGFSGSA